MPLAQHRRDAIAAMHFLVATNAGQLVLKGITAHPDQPVVARVCRVGWGRRVKPNHPVGVGPAQEVRVIHLTPIQTEGCIHLAALGQTD